MPIPISTRSQAPSPIENPRKTTSHKRPTAYLANNPHDESHFIFPVEEGDWLEGELVAAGATTLILRGRTVPVPDQAAYQRVGVNLQQPPDVRVFELCRALAHQARNAVLATSDERRFNVPDELQLLLTLDEWAHPDVVDSNKRPSGSETFQQLARVLVSGDVGEYRPGDKLNTHWRNRPDGGTL